MKKITITPLFSWLLLWFFTAPVFAIRNYLLNGRIMTDGGDTFLLVFSIVVLSVVLTGLSLFLYVGAKAVYKRIAPGKIFGNREVVTVWLIAFVVMFLIPFLER